VADENTKDQTNLTNATPEDDFFDLYEIVPPSSPSVDAGPGKSISSDDFFENYEILPPGSDLAGTGSGEGDDDVFNTEKVDENPFLFLDQNQDMLGQDIPLPLPTMGIYSDIKFEDGMFSDSDQKQVAYDQALARYNMYAQHPEAEEAFGGVKYKGKFLPMPIDPNVIKTLPPTLLPFEFFRSDMGVPTSQKVYQALTRNLPKNLAETVSAYLIDPSRRFMQENVGAVSIFDDGGNLQFPEYLSPSEISEMTEEEIAQRSAFGGKTPFTERARNMSEAVPGGLVDSLIMEGSSMAVPGVGLFKLAGKLPLVSKVPGAKTVAKTLGLEAGITAGADSDTGTVIFGDNSLFKDLGIQPSFMEGFKADPDSPEYQKEMARRSNIFLDALLITGGAEGVIEAGTALSRLTYGIFIEPVVKTGSISAREETYIRNVLNILKTTDGTPEAELAAKEQIRDLIEQGKNLYVDLPPELAKEVDVTVDTMSAIERALANNDTDAAKNLIMAAQGVRQAAIAGNNARRTQIASDRPTSELMRVTKEATDSLGGSEAIQSATESIQKQGIDEVTSADVDVLARQQDLALVESNFIERLRNDESFIGTILEIENKTGFDIGSLREKSADEILVALSNASEQMDATKNAKFNAVEGGQVDYDTLVDALEGLKPGQLDAAAGAMPANTLVGQLLDVMKPIDVENASGNMVKESAEQTKERVVEFLQNNNVDFAFLFTELRPGLVQTINNLERANTPEAIGAAKALIGFKKYIDEDAFEYLSEVGDTNTVEAATEAMRYFKDDWAKYWDDGSTLQEIGQLRRDTVGRGMKEAKFQDAGRALVGGTIGDQQRSTTANIIELLGREEAGQNAGLVTQYVIGDVLSKIAPQIDSTGKLRQIDAAAIRNAFSPYQVILRQNPLFKDEAQKIDNLIASLTDTNATKESLQKALVEAENAAQVAKDKIYQDELSNFFFSPGRPKPNGYQILSDIFNGKQSEIKINQLMARAEGNPIVQDGIKAAYSKWFKNSFLGGTTTPSGARNIRLGKEMDLQEDINMALGYGEIVFKDQPVFVNALDTLLQEAGMIQRSKGAKGIPAGSNTAELSAKIASVNRGITATLGVLSRLGAKIRAAAVGKITQSFDPTVYNEMVDRLLSDPDEFLGVMERIINKDGTINEGLMRSLAIRTGIYAPGDAEDESNFLEDLAEAEIEFNRRLDDIGGQMNDLFMSAPQ
jgi:hypothetical protein